MTPDNKTVSVYIPEGLRKRAEEAGINLSATLRDAVEEELARRDAVASALADGVEEHEVELEDATGVITGKYLGELRDGLQFYFTEDERILVYNPDFFRVNEIEDPETELSEWLQNVGGSDEGVITSAMHALGIKPRVHL